MIYKYRLSIFGDRILPEKIIENYLGDFIVDSHFNPKDKKQINISQEYGYGSISFLHPKKYSTENEIIEYEKGFIDFLEKNYSYLTQNGAEEFEIFMEIYFDGGQCNFEIFDKKSLGKLSYFKVSLPISIYLLSIKEIKDWEIEVSKIWDS